MNQDISLHEAVGSDLDALLALEEQAFSTDRLSRRSFRHWIAHSNRAFIVAKAGEQLAGYILIIYHAGTRLARLYSIATDERFRGRGIARRLILAGEQSAAASGRFFMRLEVGSGNKAAVRLYESLGYLHFGIFRDYYEDHTDALRMQKLIRHYGADAQTVAIPWIRQNTPFTCGPAALMMAMSGCSPAYKPSLHEELQIWREATTIFMTSGHGGCHPLGLALAARMRGFEAEVWINQRQPLFVDSVRGPAKKNIIEMVHKDFMARAKEEKLRINYRDISQDQLVSALQRNAIPIVLISTWRLEGKKAPHWVTISGQDRECLYLHDPDPDEGSQVALDCQYLPIAREDFASMSCFGRQRLRTAVIISGK